MKTKISLQEQSAEIEANKEEIASFFSGIIPDFVKEGGGIITDTVRFWRWKNQVNIIKKAKEKIEKSNLTKQQLPLKILSPILENSALEEDNLIQDKWANLLANAITGQGDITPNYTEILKELSSLEVVILDKLFESTSQESDYQKRKSMQFSKNKIKEIFKDYVKGRIHSNKEINKRVYYWVF